MCLKSRFEIHENDVDDVPKEENNRLPPGGGHKDETTNILDSIMQLLPHVTNPP